MTVADLSVMEVEVHGRRDRHPQRHARARRPKVRVDALEGVEDQGRGDRDRLLGHPARPAARPPAAQRPPTPRNQAKDFKVTVTLKDPPPTLRPGLNATADITTATRRTVLAVPIQAVVVREVDKEGKVVDPDAACRPRRATPVARPVREGRGEGGRVRGRRRAGRLQAGEDRHHGRDRHRGRRGPRRRATRS